MAVLLSVIAFAGAVKGQQIPATTYEKAHAIYVTSANQHASYDRRADNGNTTDTLRTPPDYVYTIDGPRSADRNSKQTFTLVPSAPVGFWWYISSGNVIEYYDDMITIELATSAAYVDIKLFDNNNYLRATKRVTITGDPYPLSGGAILTGSQSVTSDEIAGNIFATPASGGNCSGNYQYQWQYSYNDSLFYDIEDATAQDSLDIDGTISQTMYFRRKVTCGTDTQYTANVAIFLKGQLYPGTITTQSQAIAINTVPPAINAIPADGGNCGGTYSYQWQQSADGYSFANITGSTLQNLSYPTPVTGDIFFRRKVICDTITDYTNVILIRVKPNGTTAQPVVKNAIDSLLDNAGINIAQMFNLYNDSIANNRPVYNAYLDSLDIKYQDQQRLFSINNTYGSLQQSDINTLLSDSAKDNIQSRLANVIADSIPQNIPVIDSALLTNFIVSQNYKGLDSLVSSVTATSFEEAFQPVEADMNAARPEAQRTYTPTLVAFTQYNSAVINGPSLILPNQTLHYTASFYFPLGSPPDIRWSVYGGTIVGQNINPANGAIYVDVLWQNTTILQPYVGIVDVVSSQYWILNVGWAMKKCPTPAYFQGFTYPFNQTVLYGQIPAPLIVDNGTCTYPAGSYFTYQWKVVDVYQGANAQDIPGATGASYQPIGLTSPSLFYTRLTKVYNSSGTLIRSFYSNYAIVQLKELFPGLYNNLTGVNVPFNTVPQITQIMYAYGGMLVPPGGSYSYVWEASVNGGAWQQIGTGSSFPNYAITQNQKVRWTVTITGVPSSVYSLPEKYWKKVGNEIALNTSYQTQDYENRNYIRQTAVLTRGITTWEAADQLTIDKKAQSTTYLDGLSRAVQVVRKGTHYDEQTNQWYDMVQDITYEAGGRVDKSLLPYPTTENSGKYKTNVATAQPAYYQTKFGDNNAFAKAEYDNSPLNKIVKSYAPGNSWVGANVNSFGDAGLYISNVNPVHRFTVGYSEGEVPVDKGVYPTGMLSMYYGIDEKGKRILTYVNKGGLVVFKQVQLADVINNPINNNDYLCTYYVYDDFDQLRFTITPKAFKAIANNNWVITNEVANELCYWYDYDELGRNIAKKAPGKGVEYTAYDKRNRPVFIQDANMLADGNSFLATLYDDLDRPVIVGLYKPLNKTIADLRVQADNSASISNSVNTTNGGIITLWGNVITASEINNSSIFVQLRFNYFDSYTYTNAKTFDVNHANNLVYKNISTGGNVDDNTLTKRTYGMPTGTKIKVLDGNNTYLTTTLFVDEEGRVIQAQEDNIKGGVEITSTQYHFDGRVLSTSETHNGIGTAYTNFNMLTKYKFDKVGRKVGIAKKINTTSRNYITSPNVVSTQEDADAGYKIIAVYKYNELGQRVKKTLSPDYNSGQGLETIDYSYNIRGWLTGINKDYALGEYSGNQWDHYFGMYIGYDNADGKFSASQLNGQITGVQWKSQGDNTPRKFDYVYDAANRLIAANFKQRGNNTESWNNTLVDFSSKDIVYDENGNLQSLTQMGVLPGATAPVMVDKLSYQYKNNSNKLARIDDLGNSGATNGKQGDFKDGSNVAGTDDYTYDNNGNLVVDQNKKILNVQYNYLDLPSIITLEAPANSTNGSRTISYTYDATGKKLQKQVFESIGLGANRTITTTYINDFVYDAKVTNQGGSPEPDDHTDALQFITHEEGRIRIITPYVNPADPNNVISGGVALPAGKQGVFDYYIKDNLSNIRATITEEINKASSVCTMEDANSTVMQYEENLFGNPGTNNEVNSTRYTRPSLWTSAGTSSKVSKLVASGGQAKIGPNVLLRVMAGDKIRAMADYYYATDPGTNNTSTGLNGLVSSFISAITSGRTTTITHGQETQIGNSIGSNAPLQDMFNNPPAGSSPNANAPRAYLNYIFFDEQFNFVKEVSGFKRVSQSGNGANPLVLTEAKAIKNGYVYVYLSNESGEPVYFDNFAVTHERGQLISEDHYYAYGLKIASISSKSVSSSLNPNMVKHGYQSNFSEEDGDFGLNYNEFELRTYDPQIGRWTTPDPYDEYASPYLGMGNDPINSIDPNGGSVFGAIWKLFGGTISGGTSGFVGVGNACAAIGSTSATCTGLATISRITMSTIAVSGATYGHFFNQQLGSVLGNLQSSGPGDDIPESSTNPLLYTKERLKKDATNDAFYTEGVKNKQRVILRQEYYVFNENNEKRYYQNTIVLNEGDRDAADDDHKQTKYIYQRGTFTFRGDLVGSSMTTTYGFSSKTKIIVPDIIANTKPLYVDFVYHKGEIVKSSEPAAKNAAAYIATQLILYPTAKARIIGVGDFSEDEVKSGKAIVDGKEVNVNDILIERANAIVNILIKDFGIDPSRLTSSAGSAWGNGSSIDYKIEK
jgi:RHS repeat-associated protein